MIPDKTNREVFNGLYRRGILAEEPATPWDRGLADARSGIVAKYAPGSDTLDLGCGTGTYLLPALGVVKSACGVDFSRAMLEGFRERLDEAGARGVALLEADAAMLPIADCSMDFVFSFAALYYASDFAGAIREVARVLRPGGRAALEFGNRRSLNYWFSGWQRVRKGWAQVHALTLGESRLVFTDAGLREVSMRSFQTLPMYEAPRELFYLYPLLSPLWKGVLGMKAGGRMLDEYLSGAPLLRNLAFRHIVELEKI